MRKNNITLSLQNIISFLKILTSHLTGVQKILTLCFIILMLSLLGITLRFQSNSVFALSYQTYQRLDFTFNPTIQLTLSSSELIIPNLTPGSSSDSNIIDINVATNTFGGLNLISTAGNSSNDTASLVYRNGNTIIGSFDSLSANAATLEDIDSNKYGYSYSVKGNDDIWSTYSSYAGLPKYDDIVSAPATLISTTGTATSGAVKFKLGAKASSAQPSGTYTNVINFSAITKVMPTTYTINFDNGINALNWPTNISGSTSSDINIPLGSGQNQTTAPTKAGYIFKGWCTKETNNANCTGNVYQADETYPIDSIGEAVTINFYAMWQPALLYDAVASLVKLDQNGRPRTQTALDLQATITTPTSNNPATDTSNSGVYEYNSTVFGQASDASNDYKIYYYRGTLDTADGLGTYGSDGLADAYPNYVVLSSATNSSGIFNTDTCWRIVRTTGSGGVKMIYNGAWTGTTCANVQTAAHVATSAFNGTSSTYRQIVRVGYTYNNTYAANTASTATIAGVLGSNSDPSINNADSTIKDYLEGTFFSSISSYESATEPSAGYCNDRTIYNDTPPYILQNEFTNITTYGTNEMDAFQFGSNIRNFFTISDNGDRELTLNCARNIVDLYTTSSAPNGNKQMLKPVALLTADEVAFAGSGTASTNQGSVYNTKSYLNSHSNFWLLSPAYRMSIGITGGFALNSSGYLYNTYMSYSHGVRPVISLVHSATITSGSGTATDPWIISPPEN